MATINRAHVIKRGTGWAVKKQGAKKALKIHPDKESAIQQANSLRMDGYDVIIHKMDGSVQKWQKAKSIV